MKPRTLSAGAVVVRRSGGSTHFLLLRAYNYWDFPKGEVAAGEEPLGAARREVAEETTLTDLAFPWGEAFTETEPYGRGKVARYYLAEAVSGEVSLPVDPLLGRPEHHEFRWLSYEEARGLLVPRVARVLDWARGVVNDSSAGTS